MNHWKFASAMLATAILASSGFAQTNEKLQQQLDEQAAQIKALAHQLNDVKAENADLKASTQQDAIDTEINRLSERLAATNVKSGASQITFTGEFRYRSNIALGDFAGGAPSYDGFWNESRLRLGFMYDFTKDVTAYAELQSAWSFGNGAPTEELPGTSGQTPGNGTSTNVGVYQAWLRVGNIFNRSELSMKTGRQEIVMGNQFQFGNADWYHGISFDGTRYDWDSESFSLTAIVAKLASNDFEINQVSSFNSIPAASGIAGIHDADTLYSLYATIKSIQHHKIDLYWIYVDGHNGNSVNAGQNLGPNFLFGSSTAYFHTLGARVAGTFDVADGLDYNVEGAYQTGDFNSANADVDAFSGEAEVGVSFNKEHKIRVYARMLYAEGATGNDGPYLSLWTNRHSNTASFGARYGISDLTPMSNVISLQAGFTFDPAKDWTIGASGLWARDNKRIISSGARTYGWEGDLWAQYRYSEALTFSAGIALYFADDSGQALTGVDTGANFIGYMQARLFF